MASRSGHGLRLRSSGVRGGDPLRSLKATRTNRRAKLQLGNSALNELIAGTLEFERGKPRSPALIRAESANEESNGGLESPGVRAVSPALPAKAP